MKRPVDWHKVSGLLRERAREPNSGLYPGQSQSLVAIASRIAANGILIADEVGMGKTRIASEVTSAVVKSGGRVAILIPPGLSYQWKEEILQVGQPSPAFVRSLWDFYRPWSDRAEEVELENPASHHLQENVLLVSHLFANWRLSGAAYTWRWALAPTVHRILTRQNYRKGAEDRFIFNAAESIKTEIERQAPAELSKFLKAFPTEEYESLNQAKRYSGNTPQREWLERIVGWGLGSFDLIIVDEAHKSRGDESGLNRLLNRVILTSKNVRHIGLTATPVELHVDQWWESLKRIRIEKSEVLKGVPGGIDPIEAYASVVKKVRQTWRTDEETRRQFKSAAREFQKTLSPYLLRRDKKEDPVIQKFARESKLHYSQYRVLGEIRVKLDDLTPNWKQAVCAAESLSAVAEQSENSIAKRMRLTMGNGHGIAAVLDQMNKDLQDFQSDDLPTPESALLKDESELTAHEKQRVDRVEYWLKVIDQAFHGGDEAIFEHPALLACVDFVEAKVKAGEKVLVFGKFTRPLKALTDLLDARAMLRSLQSGKFWPQSKVHVNKSTGFDKWPAVRAAHAQIKIELGLSQLDEVALDLALKQQYEDYDRKKERFRNDLMRSLCDGLDELSVKNNSDLTTVSLSVLRTLSQSVKGGRLKIDLAPLARAILELTSSRELDPSDEEVAIAFCDLVKSAGDTDLHEDEQSSEALQEIADDIWISLSTRLQTDFNSPEGSFARLMYGNTSPQSRRYLQLAFNRQSSFPQVLIAQSVVGREGLNLQGACRVVVLLHPEWNPAIVEQQIGRVDRINSRWERDFESAIKAGKTGGDLPRIEIHSVVFEGTYDEHNWKVLRDRWDDLRAQLHGVIIINPGPLDEATQKIFDEIADAAPNFSP